jgi:excisionase family DNA binding protein
MIRVQGSNRWLMSTEEAASELGVHSTYLFRLVARGHLKPAAQLGGRNYWDPADLMAYRGSHPQIGQRRARKKKKAQQESA